MARHDRNNRALSRTDLASRTGLLPQPPISGLRTVARLRGAFDETLPTLRLRRVGVRASLLELERDLVEKRHAALASDGVPVAIPDTTGELSARDLEQVEWNTAPLRDADIIVIDDGPEPETAPMLVVVEAGAPTDSIEEDRTDVIHRAAPEVVTWTPRMLQTLPHTAVPRANGGWAVAIVIVVLVASMAWWASPKATDESGLSQLPRMIAASTATPRTIAAPTPTTVLVPIVIPTAAFVAPPTLPLVAAPTLPLVAAPTLPVVPVVETKKLEPIAIAPARAKPRRRVERTPDEDEDVAEAVAPAVAAPIVLAPPGGDAAALLRQAERAFAAGRYGTALHYADRSRATTGDLRAVRIAALAACFVGKAKAAKGAYLALPAAQKKSVRNSCLARGLDLEAPAVAKTSS